MDKIEKFRQAKLGMFIHWGLYSVLAGEWNGVKMEGNHYAEQINYNCKISNFEYEKIAKQFNPILFDADKWVKAAFEAGMKYLVITSKHQDGFSMFKTNVTPYNVVDATPFKRDPMKEICQACNKYGVELGFYYSHARDYSYAGANWNNYGNTWDYPPQTEADFEEYFEKKVIPQVTELLTNYGDVFVMWFDVAYKISPKLSKRLRELVLSLQPNCLINSRIGNNMGDYESLGDNIIYEDGLQSPFEACVTMNDTWGYSRHDKNWKSSKEIISIAESVISNGGNLLLNVGPDGDGLFPNEAIDILCDLGKRAFN